MIVSNKQVNSLYSSHVTICVSTAQPLHLASADLVIYWIIARVDKHDTHSKPYQRSHEPTCLTSLVVLEGRILRSPPRWQIHFVY